MSENQGKTGQRLILMDGTTIENGTAGYSQGVLCCWFTGYTLPQAAQMFLDPAKTGRIVFEYGQMSDNYEGFTNCTYLMIDSDGKVSVCLTRGNVNV